MAVLSKPVIPQDPRTRALLVALLAVGSVTRGAPFRRLEAALGGWTEARRKRKEERRLRDLATPLYVINRPASQ
jgi:hypothetical protein